MYRRICSLLLLSAAFAAGCRSTDTTAVSTNAEAAVLCEKVLPVTIAPNALPPALKPLSLLIT